MTKVSLSLAAGVDTVGSPPDTRNPTPKKSAKESKEEKASRFLHKAQDLKKAALRTKLNAVMTARPECMTEIASHLQELEYLDASLNVIQAPGAKAKASPTPKKEINNNFTRVNNMPLNKLSEWLRAMEPVTFSEMNCKSIVIRGKMQESRERLAQCFEYMTGIDPEEPLFEIGRDVAYLECFTNQLKLANVARGRLAHELILPANWAVAGFYFVESRGGKFVLVAPHHAMASTALPTSILDGASDVSHFRIHMNHSERRAIVRGPRSVTGLVCRDLFVASMTAERFSIPQFQPPALAKAVCRVGAPHDLEDNGSDMVEPGLPAKRRRALALTDREGPHHHQSGDASECEADSDDEADGEESGAMQPTTPAARTDHQHMGGQMGGDDISRAAGAQPSSEDLAEAERRFRPPLMS